MRVGHDFVELAGGLFLKLGELIFLLAVELEPLGDGGSQKLSGRRRRAETAAPAAFFLGGFLEFLFLLVGQQARQLGVDLLLQLVGLLGLVGRQLEPTANEGGQDLPRLGRSAASRSAEPTSKAAPAPASKSAGPHAASPPAAPATEASGRFRLVVRGGRRQKHLVSPNNGRGPGHAGNLHLPLDVFVRSPFGRKGGLGDAGTFRPAKLRPLGRVRPRSATSQGDPDRENRFATHVSCSVQD